MAFSSSLKTEPRWRSSGPTSSGDAVPVRKLEHLRDLLLLPEHDVLWVEASRGRGIEVSMDPEPERRDAFDQAGLYLPDRVLGKVRGRPDKHHSDLAAQDPFPHLSLPALVERRVGRVVDHGVRAISPTLV